MVCSREITWVAPPPLCGATSGRRPTQTLRMSSADRPRQHAGGLVEDEPQLFGVGLGFARQVLARRVGGAQDQLAQPGHGKQDPAVPGLGHQQRVLAGHEVPVDHDVHPLARVTIGPAPAGRRHPAGVDPDARGIDHTTRLHLKTNT
jgi:hypothetical protein